MVKIIFPFVFAFCMLLHTRLTRLRDIGALPILFLFFVIGPTAYSYSQGCCAGGSGSPIAGGTSQGVLLERQMELAASYQYLSTRKFYAQDRDTVPLFKSFFSNYIYGRAAYGVTKEFTMSVETGYYPKKQQVGLNNDTAASGGMGDLIIFPRYDVFNRTTETKRVELTLGMGWKIPLGAYNDSMIVFRDTANNINYYTASPPAVQPTTGSHDFIFYTFFFRGFPQSNFRLFANSIYIKRGWNPIGEKFGDYASASLFAGKTIFEKLGLTLSVKGEWIGKMKAAENVDLLAFYNVDTAFTGSRKIFFVPQLSFSHKAFTVYAMSEIPLYQYLNKQQIASQYLVTVGISYRFFTVTSKIPGADGDYYSCSMNCEGGGDTRPGNCKVCGMVMEKKK